MKKTFLYSLLSGVICAIMLTGPGFCDSLSANGKAPIETHEEKKDGSAVTLEEINVVSSKMEDTPLSEKTSACVEEIFRKDIKDRFFAVEDILEGVAGLNIRSTGGVGAHREVSIRGASTKQIAVYMDGIPVNAGGSGYSGLSSVPVGAISTIRVYKGNFSGSSSAGSIGGVIEIETLPLNQERMSEVSFSYGSFQTHHANAFTRFNPGKASTVALSAGHWYSKNDFKYNEDNDTVDPDDDTERTRKNAQYEAMEFLAGGRIRLSDYHEVRTKISYRDTDRGVPGFGTNLNYHTEMAEKNLLAQVKYDWLTEGSLTAWYNMIKKEFDDPEGESRTKVSKKTESDSDIFGMIAKKEWFLKNIYVRFDTEGKHEAFTCEDSYEQASVDLPSNRNSISGTLNMDIPAFSETLWLQPNLMVLYSKDRLEETSLLTTRDPERVRKTHTLLTGGVGGRYHIRRNLILRSTAGIYSRLPEFDELFGDTGTLEGNADLKAEKSFSWDMGASVAFPNLYLKWDTAVFYKKIDDIIIKQDHGDYSQYENIGKSQIIGVESFLKGKAFNDRLDYRMAVSFSEALNKSDETLIRKKRYYDKKLPYHPALETSGTLTWRLFDGVQVSTTVSHESECYTGPSNLETEKIKEKTLFDLGAAYSRRFFRVAFDITNITDEQTEDREGYPIPGRAYYVSLKFEHPGEK